MEYILLLVLSLPNPLGGEVPQDLEFMTQRTFPTISDCTAQGELFVAADSTIGYICVPVQKGPMNGSHDGPHSLRMPFHIKF